MQTGSQMLIPIDLRASPFHDTGIMARNSTTCIQPRQNVHYGLKCCMNFLYFCLTFPFALNPKGAGGGLFFSSMASFVEGKMLEQESFFNDNAAPWRITRTAL